MKHPLTTPRFLPLQAIQTDYCICQPQYTYHITISRAIKMLQPSMWEHQYISEGTLAKERTKQYDPFTFSEDTLALSPETDMENASTVPLETTTVDVSSGTPRLAEISSVWSSTTLISSFLNNQ
jgi:hypothetical protein